MEDDVEFTILNKRECFVYKIPPRSSVSGHRAADWKDCIWKGRLQVTARGKRCEIRLIDPASGDLFAGCPVPEDYSKAVERVSDSSRYFVLRIEDGSGRHAFLGMGFEERNDAFDFIVTLQDFGRRQQAEEQEEARAPLPDGPTKDYSLKQGEKIRVEIKGLKKKTGESGSSGSSSGGGVPLLAPPAGGAGRIAAPPSAGARLIRPPGAAAVVQPTAQATSYTNTNSRTTPPNLFDADALLDFTNTPVQAPSSSSTQPNKSGGFDDFSIFN
eukprot:GILK01000776.1.p1 GENE.GILK01000776.1~~GILK01000776.1.p1  ORF type:complete len:285 (-),score=56.56 GILK01000776.1:224-1036(-)